MSLPPDLRPAIPFLDCINKMKECLVYPKYRTYILGWLRTRSVLYIVVYRLKTSRARDPCEYYIL